MFDYDKIYIKNIDIESKLLPKDILNNLLTDGRVASHFLEWYLEFWFPELKRVDKKGYDHILKEDMNKFNSNENDYIKFDQKCFTKNGLKFMPSNMIGVGRKFDPESAHEHVVNIVYICCDVTELEKGIKIVFKKGIDLIKKYKNCKIPYKDRSVLFGI